MIITTTLTIIIITVGDTVPTANRIDSTVGGDWNAAMRCAAGERALLQQTQIAGRRASTEGDGDVKLIA